MTRAAFVTGLLIVLVGIAVFLIKVFGYGLSVLPSDHRGMWQVELRISVRGEGRQGSVTAQLPSSDAGQRISGMRSSSDRLVFSTRTVGDRKLGVWTGWLDGVHEILLAFRAQSFEVEVPLPDGPAQAPPEPIREAYGRASALFPSSAPPIDQMLERLTLPPVEDTFGRLTLLFQFVSHEIGTVDVAGDDAVLTLAQREGSPEGKNRLLVTLLRGAKIPARGVRGLELRQGATPRERVWTEAWVDGRWMPMSPSEGFFGRRPEGWLALGSADRSMIEATAVRAVGHRLFSLRERLRPAEIAAVMDPPNPVLSALSLYRLPVSTQTVLRALLLLPLGGLIVAIFRNLIGIPTYGTFMPILIAFAIRDYSLAAGLSLVAFVLVTGVLGRLPLERLRLLLVPRLSLLLTMVVVLVLLLAVAGSHFGFRGFLAGALFPIVILTMLIERVAITIAEEGVREAMRKAATSVLVAMTVYPVFRSELAEYLMFSFPELLLVVMGLLVWVGAYTGFRLMDLLRFRSLANGAEPAQA